MQPTVDPTLLADVVAKVTKAILHLPAERLAYSEAEAAKLIGVEPYTLRDVRLAGLIRGKKIGKRVFYAKDELVTYLAS